MNEDELDAIVPVDHTIDIDKADRGSNFQPTSEDPDRGVSAEDLDEEAENAQALRDKAAADKAKEEAEDKKVAGVDKKEDKAADKGIEDKAAEDKKGEEGKRPEPRIPLSRHKQLLENERAARAETETRLAEALKAGNREQVSADSAKDEEKVSELEATYAKQLTDGEHKEAAATMREIRTLERGIAARERAQEIAAAEERAVERTTYATTVTKIEAAYPQIDPDHESFDKAVVAEVAEMQNAFMKTGLTPTQALQKSVKYVLRPATAAQEKATELEEGDEKGKDGKILTAAERKAAAVAKAVEAASKQPPNTAKIGLDSDKAGGGAVDAKAVMKMNQADFAKLGDEELSKLRGDAL